MGILRKPFYSSVNFLHVHREPMSTTKFHYRDWSQYGPHRAEMRPSSPSRRDTPHPPGLSIQRAYNKYDEVFWIWNPNTQRLRNRYEMTLPHIEAVNFTCRHNAPSLHSKIMSSLYQHEGPLESLDQTGLPAIHPSLRATHSGRFGRRPSDPSLVGILPGSSHAKYRASASIDFACHPK